MRPLPSRRDAGSELPQSQLNSPHPLAYRSAYNASHRGHANAGGLRKALAGGGKGALIGGAAGGGGGYLYKRLKHHYHHSPSQHTRHP
jgi:hypothetical protein